MLLVVKVRQANLSQILLQWNSRRTLNGFLLPLAILDSIMLLIKWNRSKMEQIF